MALIHCAECGNEVSNKAPACPKCGLPFQVATTSEPKPSVHTETSSNLNQHKGSETVYYTDNQGVKITNTRFIVNSSTYAMNGITSIKTVEITVSKFPALACIIGGVLLILATQGRGGVAVGLGAILIVIGIIWWKQLKDKFAVQISTAAGETNAVISTDGEYILKVSRALNEAIIHRG